MLRKITSRGVELKEQFDRLSARERRMVGALGGTFALLVVVGIGYWISSGIDELRENNAEIRKALKLLSKNRAEYIKQRQRVAALEVRMGHAPLELNTFVEKAASSVGVTIAESGEISPIPADRFTRRGLEIKVNKVTIGQLSSLLKRLEDEQAHIVQITRLSVYTRWNRNQELDVEMVVSTYDRASKGQGAPTKGRSGRRGRS